MPAVGERGRPIKAQIKARARKVVHGPPVPKPRPVPPRAPVRPPRAPTYAEQRYARAKQQQQQRTEPKPPKRVYTERATPGPSSAAIERYKQSAQYIRRVQAARATRVTPAQDRAHLIKGKQREFEPAKGKEKLGPPAPHAPKPKPPKTDEPRTDRELREFLRTARRPLEHSKAELDRENVTYVPRGVRIKRGEGRTVSEVFDDISRPTPKAHKKTVVLGRTGRVTHKMGIGGGEALETALRNAPKDAAELVVTTPASVAHLAKTAATEPQKVPKMLADPYIQAVKHPTKEFTERPVSTTLLVSPFGKIPGRGAGAIARKAGKQSLERPAATLPGTTLTEKRTGSRDYFKRRAQAREDRERGAPRVAASDVRKRVDEFHDYAQHKSQQAADAAAREAKQRGMTPEQAKAHIDDARTHAKHEMDAAFAREFGAHQRPAVGAAEKQAAKAERKQAERHEERAKKQTKTRRGEVKQATTEAKAARGTPSTRLGVLEAEREAALRTVAEHTGAHTRARLEQATAKGAAAVSQARPKTSPLLNELQSKRKGAQKAKPTETVTAARKAVSVADRQVGLLQRQLAREQEAASRLQGVSEGLTKGGKMSAGVGKRIADRGDKIGALTEVIGQARKAADAARANLKAVEAGHRTATRATTKDIDKAIGAEKRRISGVAPKQAGRLHAAIEGVEGTGGAVRAARGRVRTLTQQIASEQSRTRGVPHAQANRLINAIHDLDDAKTAQAARRGERETAHERHVETKEQAAGAPLVAPAAHGRVYAAKSDANKVAERLNALGLELPAGGASPVRFPLTESGTTMKARRNVTEPLEFVAKEVGEGKSKKWMVVPKVAVDRLHEHGYVGSSKATVAKGMRISRRALTNATLATSAKWLFGQGAEAGLRSAVAGAGPLDYLRLKRVVKQMNKDKSGSGDELMTRLTGGQFGLTGAARQFAEGKSLAEEFKGHTLAAGLTHLGTRAPARVVRKGWKAYTRVVFDSINGVIEQTARKAMAGQALKQGAFNEKRINALSDRAISDAAKGLKGTAAQVQLARQVDRMYGQYQKFSPEMRSLLMHWTPFLPWYLNSVKFVGSVLPKDHPILTSLLASTSNASEEWRKANNLSLKGEDFDPFELQDFVKYTPMGAFSDPGSAVARMALPQITGTALNLLGVDWTGKRLRRSDTREEFTQPERWARAATSLAESQVPLVSIGGRLSGLTKKHIDKKAPEDIPPLSERAIRELPFGSRIAGARKSSSKATGPAWVKPIKVTPVRVKPVRVGKG